MMHFSSLILVLTAVVKTGFAGFMNEKAWLATLAALLLGADVSLIFVASPLI